MFFTRIFFGTMRLFWKFFWFPPEGLPSFVSIICNTMDVKKLKKGPPFTFLCKFYVHFYVHFYYRHCDTVQKSQFYHFFRNFPKSPKGPLFFFIFCNQLEFHKAQRLPLFTILGLRYSALLLIKEPDNYSHSFLVGTFLVKRARLLQWLVFFLFFFFVRLQSSL